MRSRRISFHSIYTFLIGNSDVSSIGHYNPRHSYPIAMHPTFKRNTRHIQDNSIFRIVLLLYNSIGLFGIDDIRGIGRFFLSWFFGFGHIVFFTTQQENTGKSQTYEIDKLLHANFSSFVSKLWGYPNWLDSPIETLLNHKSLRIRYTHSPNGNYIPLRRHIIYRNTFYHVFFYSNFLFINLFS